MAPNLPITHIIGAWFKHRNWCCYVVFKSYYFKQWFGASVEIEGGNEMYGYISGGSFSICKLSMYSLSKYHKITRAEHVLLSISYRLFTIHILICILNGSIFFINYMCRSNTT